MMKIEISEAIIKPLLEFSIENGNASFQFKKSMYLISLTFEHGEILLKVDRLVTDGPRFPILTKVSLEKQINPFSLSFIIED
jgi:hypothetical protein